MTNAKRGLPRKPTQTDYTRTPAALTLITIEAIFPDGASLEDVDIESALESLRNRGHAYVVKRESIAEPKNVAIDILQRRALV